MAPRTAKPKKAADAKVTETEKPKKGRAKAKVVEDDLPEVEYSIEVPAEKPKRGKKAVQNGQKINGTEELITPEPKVEYSTEVLAEKPKRGKKAVQNGQKNNGTEELITPEPKGNKKTLKTNEDNSSEKAESPGPEAEPGNSDLETIGHSEDAPITTNGKDKKKQTKKKAAPKKAAAPKKGQAKKISKQSSSETEDAPAENDEKIEPTGKGKGRKGQQKTEKTADEKIDNEDQSLPIKKKAESKSTKDKKSKKSSNADEVQKDEPKSDGIKKNMILEEKSEDEAQEDKVVDEPAKELKSGKKKVQGKVPKNPQLVELKNEEEHIPVDDPPKKEVKGKKNQKKVPTKAEPVVKEDSQEDEPASKKMKTLTNEEGQGDGIEADEAIVEVKPTKGKRGQKNTVEVPIESQHTGEPSSKRKRKVTEDQAPAEDNKKKALKNKASTNYEEIDFSNSSEDSQGRGWNLKISSWNVDGIRAWMTKGGLDFIKYEKPDILCLQEVKCAQDKLPEEIVNLPGYHAYWLCSDKDGYAGVGIYTTKLAMNVTYGLQDAELDDEGRIITAEYEEFYLICTYVVNAGRKLVTLPKRLHWNEEFRKHVKQLDEKKPVIICGDMNVAHNEIDLSRPQSNRRNAGFTDEERSGMSDLLGDGFVDTFRLRNPGKTGAYTFWTYMMNCRAKNVGWRLDYFIVSQRLLPAVCDSVLRSEVYGSDHCPITLFLHLTSAQKPTKELA